MFFSLSPGALPTGSRTPTAMRRLSLDGDRPTMVYRPLRAAPGRPAGRADRRLRSPSRTERSSLTLKPLPDRGKLSLPMSAPTGATSTHHVVGSCTPVEDVPHRSSRGGALQRPPSLRTVRETRRFTRLKQPARAGRLCVSYPYLLVRRLGGGGRSGCVS